MKEFKIGQVVRIVASEATKYYSLNKRIGEWFRVDNIDPPDEGGVCTTLYDGLYVPPGACTLVQDSYESIGEATQGEITHPQLVKALTKSGQAILESMTAQDADLLHVTVGVAGEAGELLDAVKKAVIYRKPIDIENVVEELGDLEFYMERIRQILNITREQTIEANIAKLSVRYGKVYSDQSAQDRADKAA